MDNHKVIISGKHYSILLPFKMDHIIIPEFKQVEKRLLVLCLTLVLMGRIKNQKNVVERKNPTSVQLPFFQALGAQPQRRQTWKANPGASSLSGSPGKLHSEPI